MGKSVRHTCAWVKRRESQWSVESGRVSAQLVCITLHHPALPTFSTDLRDSGMISMKCVVLSFGSGESLSSLAAPRMAPHKTLFTPKFALTFPMDNW